MGVAESATYRGYPLIVDDHDIMVIAPDGDVACFYSMARVRKWVRRKQIALAHQRPEEVMDELRPARSRVLLSPPVPVVLAHTFDSTE